MSHWRFADAHCHLDLSENMSEVAARSLEKATAVLAMTTTPRAWTGNFAFSQRHSGISVALGLHPQLVSPTCDEFDLWRSLLPQASYIGEVGLDASPRHYRHFDLQQDVFIRVLRACNEAGDKVLSLHTVRAVPRTLQLLEQHLGGGGCRVILHWFTGTISEARRALELGCYFSVNHQMLSNPAHARTLQHLPLERILTETDGPFTECNGRASEPPDVAETVKLIAALRQEDLEGVRRAVFENFRNLVNV